MKTEKNAKIENDLQGKNAHIGRQKHLTLSTRELQALTDFANAMRGRLEESAEKGDFTALHLHPFEGDGVGYLLIDKWHKLAGALGTFDSPVDLELAQKTATDVANYALMIYTHVTKHIDANAKQTALWNETKR